MHLKKIHFCEAPRSMLSNYFGKNKNLKVKSGAYKCKCTLRPLLSQTIMHLTFFFFYQFSSQIQLKTRSPLDQFHYCLANIEEGWQLFRKFPTLQICYSPAHPLPSSACLYFGFVIFIYITPIKVFFINSVYRRRKKYEQ